MLSLLKKTVTQFSDDNCSRMAAALAYYTTFSLAPLLLLILSVGGLMWNSPDLRGTIEEEIGSLIGPDGAGQIKRMLAGAENQQRGAASSLIAIGFLFLGATGVVGQLQSALNDVWGVTPDPEKDGVVRLFVKRCLSFAMICAVAFLLLVSLVVSAVMSAAGKMVAAALPEGTSETFLNGLNLSVSMALIAVLFAGMYKFLPDAKIRWADALPGAVITAGLFTVGKYAIGAYLGSKNMENAYGAAGSLVLLMLWIYYSAIIFLLGAEFTNVWAQQRGAGIRPAKGAVRVVKQVVRKD